MIRILLVFFLFTCVHVSWLFAAEDKIIKKQTLDEIFLELPSVFFKNKDSNYTLSPSLRKKIITAGKQELGKNRKEMAAQGEKDLSRICAIFDFSSIRWSVCEYDPGHGYLYFFPETDGEGTSFVIAIFKKKDQSNLVAISKTNWGMSHDEQDLKMYQKIDNQWKNVTSQVFPKLSLRSLLVKEPVIQFSQLSKAFKKYLESPAIRFTLPQKGTTILANLNFDSEDDIFEGEMTSYDQSGLNKYDKKIYEEIQKNAKEQLEIYWNGEQFSITPTK